ncbi:MAG: hypothetical protein AAGA56_16400, partial [Myxococcota bacterium]
MTRHGLIGLLGLLVIACGGDRPAPEVAGGPNSASIPQRPRDADERAVQLVGAKVRATLFMDRLSGHRLGDELVAQEQVRRVFAGTGIDPRRDADRVFVAARSLQNQVDVAVLVEHHAPPDKVEAALVARAEKGGRVDRGDPFWTAEFDADNRRTVAAVLSPTLLLFTSPKYKAAIASFEGTGGLPRRRGHKMALVSVAEDPATTLRVRKRPRIPPTLKELTTQIALTPDGGALLLFLGDSGSDAQAAADAKFLSREIEDLVTPKVLIFRVKTIDPIVFMSAGPKNTATRVVKPKVVDLILSFA